AKELNDTQRLILSAAAARGDLRALPLPETLRAPVHIVKKTVATMIEHGLLGEITALPDDAVWTESNPGGRVTLVATPAGLAAIGVEQEVAPPAPSPDQPPAPSKRRSGGSKSAESARQAPAGDRGTKQSKQDVVLALLRRPEGASIPEMVAATDWQPHSVRGFMSGALKKRLGLEVASEKDEKGERRYHVPTAEAEDPNT
ncbi:MAG: DUF3489 domain-containing protein, partial [Dehalococcoidia bacterium]